MVAPQGTYKSYAVAAISTLQQFYNQTTGLYNTTGWWNSANCMTTLADFATIDNTTYAYAPTVFQNTYIAAQDTGLSLSRYGFYVKAKDRHGLVQTEMKVPDRSGNSSKLGRIEPRAFKGFINDYYDDEGWWALAWIEAYDLTDRPEYLALADSLFLDMTYGWNNFSCGGIFWRKTHDEVNAIENELFISVAANLATRTIDPQRRQFYIAWAEKVWSWFQETGMINSNWNINDGINLRTCKNDGDIVWSYNQGVILGALVELNEAAPNIAYLETATRIADAAIKKLADSKGVLHDVCEPRCGADGDQFKGIFMRNLLVLHEVAPQDRWKDFMLANADSIWLNDRASETGNLFGTVWSGPYKEANAGTQGSASDALVAAAILEENSTATLVSEANVHSDIVEDSN